MAFPFISEVNFEDGTTGSFDSETDTNSKLAVRHYSELSRTPGLPAPYQGAYCLGVDLSLGTADAYLQENVDWDMSLAENQFWRFMLWVDPSIVMATTNQFSIFTLQSTGPVDEVNIDIRFTTASGFQIGATDGVTTNWLPLTLGKWLAVELDATLDSGGGDDGTIDLYIDGAPLTTITGADQAAIVQGRIGTMNLDAGTTRGWVLFDDIISDDARIFPRVSRWSTTRVMTASGHVFVGSGVLANVSLLSGGSTDNVIGIFDTDTGYTSDASNLRAELKNTANSELVDPAGMPANVIRGCYVNLAGTNPRALVQIGSAKAYGSDGAVRTYGSKRLEARGEV